MRTFFVTLNWNTTALFKRLLKTVENTTPEPHTWVIVDNGSRQEEQEALLDVCLKRLTIPFLMFNAKRNLGCVLGHNAAFDMCAKDAGAEPYEIVMFDTDVEVYQSGWLTKVRQWCERDIIPGYNEIGIVGLEHSQLEICAGAVFLDTSGNWTIHRDQTKRAEPVRAESVGLGMAFLRWPVTKLRFDTGYKLYYKQDDDLCFQVRANLSLDVWAYPLEMIHWGCRGLRENEYNVTDEVRGREKFEEIKRGNQRYFAKKWSWALRGRRPLLVDETAHLEAMDTLMRERRMDSGFPN